MKTEYSEMVIAMNEFRAFVRNKPELHLSCWPKLLNEKVTERMLIAMVRHQLLGKEEDFQWRQTNGGDKGGGRPSKVRMLKVDWAALDGVPWPVGKNEIGRYLVWYFKNRVGVDVCLATAKRFVQGQIKSGALRLTAERLVALPAHSEAGIPATQPATEEAAP